MKAATFRDRLLARLDDELADARAMVDEDKDAFDGFLFDGDGAPASYVEIVRAQLAEAHAELLSSVERAMHSREVIADETERMVDGLVAAVARDEALRPSVKGHIRADLVAWPTPWARSRDFVDVQTETGGTVRMLGTASGEEIEERARNPALDAISRVVLERDARAYVFNERRRKHLETPAQPDELVDARRVFAAYDSDVDARDAWRAIGTAEDAAKALSIAARLARVDMGRTDKPRPVDSKTGAPRDPRPGDRVEVPSVGWVYVSTLALVGRALCEATRPAEIVNLATGIILKDDGSPLARHERAQVMLSRAVEDWISRAPTCSDDAAPVDGVHPLDEALAALLDAIGKQGQTLAADVRESSKGAEERAARWRPYVAPLRVARLLARALWHDVVGQQVERAAYPVGAPGLALPILTNLVGLSRHGAQRSLLSAQSEDIIDHRERRVGSIHLMPSIKAEHVKLAHLGTLSATRLVRFLLHQTYTQKHIQQIPDATRVDIEGGFDALAEMLGMTGKKAAGELRKAADTLASVWIETPQGDGQVFGYFHHKPTKNRRARLEMHVMGPFAPDYIGRSLAGYRGDAQHKYLVPVPLPQQLPPLFGRGNDRAAQALLQVLVLREMRIRAVEMVETGTVEIGPRRWDELRDEASVPKAILPQVLDTYRTGDDDGRPPFLQSPTTERYALTDAYARERGAILQAGEAMRAGAEGGRKAAANRRKGKPRR